MAFPTYGTTLLAGFAGQPESVVSRTEFETGPAKQYKLKSQTGVRRDPAIQYSDSEFASFESWFRGAECNWGAGWFDWTDPRDGQTKTARVFGGDYQYRSESSGEGGPLHWVVTLQLEVMEG